MKTRLISLESTGSTNDHLKALAREGAEARWAGIAEPRLSEAGAKLLDGRDVPLFPSVEEALRNHKVDAKELSTRKLDPALKRKMRARILVEAGADLLLPAPVQIVYHAWQLVTLKSF